MPRVTVLENIRENAPSVSERVFRKSKKKPTDYSLNLSWRRWPILVIFMVYGMTATFQNTQFVIKPELFRLRYLLTQMGLNIRFLVKIGGNNGSSAHITMYRSMRYRGQQ